MVGEYIRRDEALAAVAVLWKDYGADGVCKAINRMHSIEVRPVTHAQWIDHNKWLYYCSSCLYMFRDSAAEDVANEFLYCPNCDAEMDGGAK